MKRFALLALTFAALAAAVPRAQAQAPEAPVSKDWDVFVDLPTGFAFVKTPAGLEVRAPARRRADGTPAGNHADFAAAD